ncbi:MAG: T9SS type A sorting domain-containing protein, partial [Bacteroidales bacterium]|nr:T9SS type A sorting domain-containing protein [Bacteroidales bacterium]
KFENLAAANYQVRVDVNGKKAAELQTTLSSNSSAVENLDITIKSGSGTTAVETLDNDLVFLYPNPSSHLVTVQGADCKKIQLVDIKGVLLQTVEDTNTVDVSGLFPSEYLMLIETVDNTVITKTLFVK